MQVYNVEKINKLWIYAINCEYGDISICLHDWSNFEKIKCSITSKENTNSTRKLWK